ncbi:hypothetical protein SAMN06264348_10797 [Oceanospirillum linum]|nr:hypothetical protein SAMN04489856_10897 [Oleiphilus messinensis]SMP29431.1 hypothetical protein SAMN06264348_10797 [Oceanospirillum linum]
MAQVCLRKMFVVAGCIMIALGHIYSPFFCLDIWR